MKQENKELLNKLGEDSLTVAKVVGRGTWWLTKVVGRAAERVFERGADNLSEAMRTKDHQKTVWDGVVPTKYTVEDLKKNKRYYTIREMDRRNK